MKRGLPESDKALVDNFREADRELDQSAHDLLLTFVRKTIETADAINEAGLWDRLRLCRVILGKNPGNLSYRVSGTTGEFMDKFCDYMERPTAENSKAAVEAAG